DSVRDFDDAVLRRTFEAGFANVSAAGPLNHGKTVYPGVRRFGSLRALEPMGRGLGTHAGIHALKLRADILGSVKHEAEVFCFEIGWVHNGIFPCLRGGFLSRLVANIRKAAISLGR